MKNLIVLSFVALLLMTTTVAIAQPTPKVTGVETQTQTTTTTVINNNSKPNCKIRQGKRVHSKKQRANKVTRINGRRGQKCNKKVNKKALKTTNRRQKQLRKARRASANS